MKRVGQVIRLRPEYREAYLALHAEPWPGVLATLQAANIRNYSIFEYGELLFAYFEYTGEDWAADTARIAADPVTQAWWARTDPCQERLPGTPDGEQWLTLPQVFCMPGDAP
ncbi:L-rhamnose mutarotase (plasmid) [Deinococcus metallilatus]|uniref:L-rhamnose mutarotase n=1 Tax=Deinococcus metallilatus TaxID=1211322 RepID=A0AAJ5K718_9DEIO|nr:L-rhamnose mutarotase [Deinococcus metallilatus]QBY07077.1 L-rhamnose mutarotase [Deinococcus metallilatus]RXJ18159.1 L-rhamnose mutarotase [Deinococcus metallilatus]TLK32366.1 L-rhamnose mutarotase [Deinococcus metallilatus]